MKQPVMKIPFLNILHILGYVLFHPTAWREMLNTDVDCSNSTVLGDMWWKGFGCCSAAPWVEPRFPVREVGAAEGQCVRDAMVPRAHCCLLPVDSGLSDTIYIAYFGVAAWFQHKLEFWIEQRFYPVTLSLGWQKNQTGKENRKISFLMISYECQDERAV